MEIVGIFDVVADKDDQVNMYDDSSYYEYSSFVFCSMEAAEGLIKGLGRGRRQDFKKPISMLRMPPS